MSIWYQLDELLAIPDIKSLLDIGPGSDLFRNTLLALKSDIRYKTLDIADDVGADYIGGITNIPRKDNSHDVVSAFQVLEHISFDDVPQALRELQRVAAHKVLISVPHYGPQCTFSLKVPFIPQLRFAVKIPYPKKLTFNGQHYWEIGRKGYPARRFNNLLRQYFVIEKEYVPFENQYHRFYVLQPLER